MIVYSSNAMQFRQAVDRNRITVEIDNAYINNLGKRPNPIEKRAWNNSMQFMKKII